MVENTEKAFLTPYFSPFCFIQFCVVQHRSCYNRWFSADNIRLFIETDPGSYIQRLSTAAIYFHSKCFPINLQHVRSDNEVIGKHSEAIYGICKSSTNCGIEEYQNESVAKTKRSADQQCSLI